MFDIVLLEYFRYFFLNYSFFSILLNDFKYVQRIQCMEVQSNFDDEIFG